MEYEKYNLNLSNINNYNNIKKNKILTNKIKFFIILSIISISYFFLYKFYLDKAINKIGNKDKINLILNNSQKSLYNQNEILKSQDKILLKLYNKNNISFKLKLLKIISNNNVLKYKGIENCLLNDPDSQYCIYHLIIPKNVIGKKRILIGKKKDGCYVLLNDFKDIKYAYSFGIYKNIQFDKDLADRGIDIYMYDHTINSLPYNNSKFHWKKIGISGRNKKIKKVKTLEEILIENGHSLEKNMILKIDVEHCEWESLKDISSKILIQFKYIAIEFHFTNINEGKLYYKVLKKLQKTHQVFYLRCHGRNNIITFGNNRICLALEASYIIKEGNKFSKDESIYPIFKFDFTGPNINGKSEINLNILKLFDFD